MNISAEGTTLSDAWFQAFQKMIPPNPDNSSMLDYDTLNNNGKVLLLEYLTGLLRVPTYLQESEYGVDEELITDLNAEKDNLKNSK